MGWRRIAALRIAVGVGLVAGIGVAAGFVLAGRFEHPSSGGLARQLAAVTEDVAGDPRSDRCRGQPTIPASSPRFAAWSWDVGDVGRPSGWGETPLGLWGGLRYIVNQHYYTHFPQSGFHGVLPAYYRVAQSGRWLKEGAVRRLKAAYPDLRFVYTEDVRRIAPSGCDEPVAVLVELGVPAAWPDQQRRAVAERALGELPTDLYAFVGVVGHDGATGRLEPGLLLRRPGGGAVSIRTRDYRFSVGPAVREFIGAGKRTTAPFHTISSYEVGDGDKLAFVQVYALVRRPDITADVRGRAEEVGRRLRERFGPLDVIVTVGVADDRQRQARPLVALIWASEAAEADQVEFSPSTRDIGLPIGAKPEGPGA